MRRSLYDAAVAAELLSTSQRRIHELRRAGVLGAVQDGPGVQVHRRRAAALRREHPPPTSRREAEPRSRRPVRRC